MEQQIPSATLQHPRYRAIWAHPLERPDWQMDIPRRLALELGLTNKEAAAAIEEYRRFAFLAAVCPHPVTPPDQIDMVWHLHLLYTRDYWQQFCPVALGRELHHGPTMGGAQEENRYYEQYAQTLASYAKWFGPPPEKWWPPARKRFEPIRNWRWIYLPDFIVLPRPIRALRRTFSNLRTYFQLYKENA
jgi:hypothetical protein